MDHISRILPVTVLVGGWVTVMVGDVGGEVLVAVGCGWMDGWVGCNEHQKPKFLFRVWA